MVSVPLESANSFQNDNIVYNTKRTPFTEFFLYFVKDLFYDRILLMLNRNARASKAFTIVELLVVIVVIGILAAITVVAYNGIQNRVKIAVIQTELAQNYNQLVTFATTNNDQYPGTTSAAQAAGIKNSPGTSISYIPSVSTVPAAAPQTTVCKKRMVC